MTAKKILVVDDEPDFCDAFGEFLVPGPGENRLNSVTGRPLAGHLAAHAPIPNGEIRSEELKGSE